MKKAVILFFIAFMLMGCANEEVNITNDLKSKVEGKYNIVIFVDGNPIDDFQQRINHTLMNKDEVWGEKVISVGYIILDENTPQDYNYEKVLSLNEFPEILVFDDKEEVFRTSETDELETFLLK